VTTAFMPTTRRTTVLIADDHPIVMEGLVRLLEEYDFNVVGAAANGQQLIEAARQLRPDVIVTDLTMPVLGGLDVLARLKEHRIHSKVVVLTMHNDAERATQALKSGASGFLLKESAGEELITAIRQALEGRVYLTSAVTKAVIERMADSGGRPAHDLTPRQLDVLRLIVKGQRMKEIATTLNLSTRTVETHKYEMMQVLGLHSTAELVKYAIKQHLAGD
jgi:DNA-binding NarL/FixJ family response regulator